jgi:uroporphyrinogen-III synthase
MPQSVLILRPEPGNAATAAKVRALGFEPICLPLFEAHPVNWTCPDPLAFDGVLITSANAIRHAGPQLAKLVHLPAYAVGPATAEAAKAAGFSRIETGPSNVAALLEHIVSSGKKHRLLHLGRGDDLPPIYDQIAVNTLKIYEMIFLETSVTGLISDPAPIIALIHSPQAGARFAALIGASKHAREHITVLAISSAAAQKAGTGWRRVAIAPEPRDEAMLSSLLLLAGLKEE